MISEPLRFDAVVYGNASAGHARHKRNQLVPQCLRAGHAVVSGRYKKHPCKPLQTTGCGYVLHIAKMKREYDTTLIQLTFAQQNEIQPRQRWIVQINYTDAVFNQR